MAGFEFTGTSIAFQSGLLADVHEFSGGGMSREAIDVSTFATVGAMEYIAAALVDLGTFEAVVNFDATRNPQDFMTAPKEAITINWSDTDATEWTTEGFAEGFTFTGVMGDRGTGTITIRIANDLTVTP